MKEIIITCDLRDSLKLSEFADLQPKSFKEMSKDSYQKFRLGMQKAGFHEPIKVWVDNGINYIVDGHHRIKILNEFLKEGYEIPLIPVYYVECKNRKDAIRMLLASNSHYAVMTPEGLHELLEVEEIELDVFETIELKGNDIKLDKFQQEFYLDAEINEKELDENIETKHECPQCHYKWS